MSVTFGFYNSIGNDRVYDASDISGMFSGFYEPGVFKRSGNGLKVVPGTGMEVMVSTGRCWFEETWTKNDDFLNLPIDPAPGEDLLRYDAICIQVNNSLAGRENSFVVVKGVEGTVTGEGAAEWPGLTNDDGAGIHQHALAIIKVQAGMTSITAADITDNRGVYYSSSSDIPFSGDKTLYDCRWCYVGVDVDTAEALLKSGGIMNGPLELGDKLILGIGTYGTDLPETGVEGQIFFKIPVPEEST